MKILFLTGLFIVRIIKEDTVMFLLIQIRIVLMISTLDF
jgi:hypothetical protein